MEELFFNEDENLYSSEGAEEQTIGERFPELKLDMSDEKILNLTRKWKSSGQAAMKNMSDIWDQNVDYWKGHFDKYSDWMLSSEDKRQKDNRIFSGIETLLPILTRQSPDPIVEGKKNEEARKIADKVRMELVRLMDVIRFKLKLKRVARYWLLYHLGVAKVFWNKDENRVDVRIIKPKNLIFQQKASIEEGIYNGEFIGEYVTKSAGEVKKLFPKHKEFIDKYTDSNDGTMLTYIEWHTNEFVVWEFNELILDKIKNPDWNYDSKKKTVDEQGAEITKEEMGKNHFRTPQMPYAFFSVYNLGESVFDVTGLIQQAKAAQDIINNRMCQIDKNVENQNNSVAFYGLDETQAEGALDRIRRGEGLLFTNKQEQGFDRIGGNQLASDIYQELNLARNTVDSTLAANPITRGEESRDQTVRGKIIAKQGDVDRISFVAEHLEQFVDRVLNLMVQDMYVYYEEKTPKDDENGIHRDDFNDVGELIVSVKDGSLIPKDPLTEANQAVDLFGIKAIDLLTLYERLDIENPKETAVRTMLFNADPKMYLEEVLDYKPPEPEQPPAPEMPEGIAPPAPPPAGAPPAPPVPQVPEAAMPQVPPEQQNILNQVPIQ